MARFTGRLDEAPSHVAALQRLAGEPGRTPTRGSARAASFAATAACATARVTAPFPPRTSLDPVDAMAGLIIQAELTLAGRVEESLARLDHSLQPVPGPIGDLGGVFRGLTLVLAGRLDEARPWVERAAGAARSLDAGPAATAAGALLAEIAGDPSSLPPPDLHARSVADALVLRAWAVSGDETAADALHRATKALAMPGLAIGV